MPTRKFRSKLKKFFGASGTVYYVVQIKRQQWMVFVETPDGFRLVEAKKAAIDCGAKGTPSDLNAQAFWNQIWKQ
jgi:hypothetical protein